MGTINTLGSERAAVAAVIDPDANTAAAYTSTYVSMATFNQVMAVVQAGTLGSSATLSRRLIRLERGRRTSRARPSRN